MRSSAQEAVLRFHHRLARNSGCSFRRGWRLPLQRETLVRTGLFERERYYASVNAHLDVPPTDLESPGLPGFRRLFPPMEVGVLLRKEQEEEFSDACIRKAWEPEPAGDGPRWEVKLGYQPPWWNSRVIRLASKVFNTLSWSRVAIARRMDYRAGRKWKEWFRVGFDPRPEGIWVTDAVFDCLVRARRGRPIAFRSAGSYRAHQVLTQPV